MIPVLRQGGLLRSALRLGIPVAVANLVVAATLMVELLIIGREVGEKAVGAANLAGILILIFVLAFHAVEIAAQAIVSRRFGERAYHATGACLDNAIILSAGLGLFFAVVLMALGPRIFGARDPEIASMAFEYFRWRLPSVPMLTVILAIVGFLNGIGKSKIPLYIYAVVLIAHLSLVYSLAGGHWGMPRLGVKGAGLAATISTALGLIAFILYLVRPSVRHRYETLHFVKHFSPQVLRSLMHIGSPVFVQQLISNASIFLFQRVNARVDDAGVSLDVSAIAYSFANLGTLPVFGFGIAAASLAGHALGARQPRRAELAVRTCWAMGAVYTCVLGVFYAIFGDWLTKQFFMRVEHGGGDPVRLTAIVLMGQQVFIVLAAYQIVDSMSTILGKALQGVGSGRIVLVTNVLTQWLVLLPLAWLLAVKLGFGAVGAWVAMLVYLATNAAVYGNRFFHGHWKHNKV